MTDEELQQAIQEVSQRLKNLAESEKPLTKHESRQKRVLLLKNTALQGMKKAREKGDDKRELRYGIYYEILTSWGEKHPFLARLVMRNLSWELFH